MIAHTLQIVSRQYKNFLSLSFLFKSAKCLCVEGHHASFKPNSAAVKIKIKRAILIDLHLIPDDHYGFFFFILFF